MSQSSCPIEEALPTGSPVKQNVNRTLINGSQNGGELNAREWHVVEVASAVRRRYLRIPFQPRVSCGRESVIDHRSSPTPSPIRSVQCSMGSLALCTYRLGFLKFVDEELSS